VGYRHQNILDVLGNLSKDNEILTRYLDIDRSPGGRAFLLLGDGDFSARDILYPIPDFLDVLLGRAAPVLQLEKADANVVWGVGRKGGAAA